MDLREAARRLQAFERSDLAGRLALLETAFRFQARDSARAPCEMNSIAPDLLEAAFVFKAAAGQVNVLIHAIGILTALPHILKDGE